MKLSAAGSIVVVVLTLCLCAPAQESHPTLRWSPEVHAIYQLHSHHLNAAHHAAILRTFAPDAKSIPREVVNEHLDEIEKSLNSSKKAVERLPKDATEAHRDTMRKLYGQSLERVSGLRKAFQRPAFSQDLIPTLAKPLHGDLWSSTEDLDRLNRLLGLPVIHRRPNPQSEN